MVSPKPGSARTQVSVRFCTLTSPESIVPRSVTPGPLARQPVCPGQTARILRAVLPPFNGGLHCGMRSTKASGRASAAVLPPFNGGLHCGATGPIGRVSRARWCSRLSTAGSIAASSASAWVAGTAGAPAFQRRAPLRPPAAVGSAMAHGTVLPPFNGGLHCGLTAPRCRARPVPACSRLSTAGSIAAGERGYGAVAGDGAPAFQRRAPLRL